VLWRVVKKKKEGSPGAKKIRGGGGGPGFLKTKVNNLQQDGGEGGCEKAAPLVKKKALL